MRREDKARFSTARHHNLAMSTCLKSVPLPSSAPRATKYPSSFGLYSEFFETAPGSGILAKRGAIGDPFAPQVTTEAAPAVEPQTLGAMSV